ncbi:hypothetical protein NHQ30_010155 [Ciborinia camelliae]|nr:hypothetical protein NHQ30_010155 [Ciborinia camelliae]
MPRKDCRAQDWPNHKAMCKRQNFILRVDLSPRYLTNPRVTRTISCPATASFADLHDALQVAFGWKNCHLHNFEVLNHNKTMGSESIFSMQPIMFSISAPDMLGEVVSESVKSSDRTLLHQVLDDEATRDRTIHYQYDYGDNWEHVIICGGRADPTLNFVVLGGEGHGCAEDVGGYGGWTDLIEAYESDNPTEDQQASMTWFEEKAHNKDPKGLRGAAKYTWDKDRINSVLQELDTSNSARPASSILLISLAKEFWFDEMYAAVIAKLRSKTTVKEVTSGISAMKHLGESKIQNYTTIILTDAAIMEPRFIVVNDKLVGYAKSGGTVIFGFMMPTLAEPPTFERFMKESWGLNWRFGDYTRETYVVNPRAHLNQNRQLEPYSMKALSLQNAEIEDRVYSGPERARHQSPAIFAKYGSNGTKQGHVGWIGDVNTEEGTTTLLLAMCGLGD